MATEQGDALLMQFIQGVVFQYLEAFQTAKLEQPGSELVLLEKIQNIMSQFGLDLGEIIGPTMVAEYFGSVDAAGEMLAEAGDALNVGMALTPEGMISEGFQKPIHINAVREIVDSSMMDLTAAVVTAQAAAAATIPSAVASVRERLAQGLIRGDARKTIQKQVMADFLKKGQTSFAVTDKNGKVRNLPLDFYAMTVVRTKMREATTQGSVNRFVDAGQDLVEIIGNGDSCEICAKFNGLTVSLNGKTDGFPKVGGDIRLPPFHPNCRCNIRVVILKFVSDEELIRRNRRNAAFDPEEDPRTPAQKAEYEKEQALRRVANAEKKQFIRWQQSLGAEAPKTLGAFRRMKRQNTVKFQQLQSEVFSNAQTGAVRKPRIVPAGTPPVAANVKMEPPVKNFKEADYKFPDGYTMRKEGDRIYKEMDIDEANAYNNFVSTSKSWRTNKFLYSGDYERAMSGELDMFEPRVESNVDNVDGLSALIRKHTLPEPMKTVRMVDSNFLESVMTGVGLEPRKYQGLKAADADFLEDVRGTLTGVRYTNKSFASVSYSPTENLFRSKPIRMELFTEAGQKGLITRNHSESEIILDRDTEFEFLGFEVEEGENADVLVVKTRVVQ